MTDQPGRPPEERLPAPRPSSAPVPAERFSAPPSAHRSDLTPERAGRIVRQSANARWVGFLAVVVVSLFIIGYYFYELGLPGGLSTPRMDSAAQEQQVTSIERGYNLYQANCAQCHGVNGEGGKGPILNRQDKLYAHLNPD
jgi:cytochrome c553